MGSWREETRSTAPIHRDGPTWDILEGNLTQGQYMKLYDMDWDLHERPYKETIAKLESLEASIVESAEVQKGLALLETKKAFHNGNFGKRSRSPAGKLNKSTTSVSCKTLPCKHCGKIHNGKCWPLTAEGPPKKQV